MEHFNTGCGYMDWSERDGENYPFNLTVTTQLQSLDLSIDEARQLRDYLDHKLRAVDETPERYAQWR